MKKEEIVRYLNETTAHLDPIMRADFISTALAKLAREEAEEERIRKRTPLGNPEMRGQCCDKRPKEYPIGTQVKDVPDLRGLLAPLNEGWSRLLECRICGQEWTEEWEQLKAGGRYHLKKLSNQAL